MEKRLQEIATRKAELTAQLGSEEKGLDLDAIKKELEELDNEEKSINEKIEAEEKKAKEEAEARKQTATKINEGKLDAKELKEKEMENTEIRNTKEYIEAFERYVRTNDATEVRSLLTENVGGTIAVPDFVLDEIKTAWDNEEIMALVRKTSFKGNLKVNFEISSTGAVKHLEGSEAVAEETLLEGIVKLIPSSFKKWISISDEVYDMRGEAFLRYIYKEIAHYIAKQVADDLVGQIKDLPTTADSTHPRAKAITKAPALDTFAEAIGNLSDEATNPVAIMNKLTWSVFKKEQYNGNFSVDIFEGLKVLFNNTLPAYSTAEANDVYLIIGDLGYGAHANFPDGQDTINFKFDELTRKKEDMIEILGREYVAVAPVACDAFVNVKKPSASV